MGENDRVEDDGRPCVATGHDEASAQPLWIRAAVDDDTFGYEQAALGKLWTFVGFTTDIPNEGDWFRTRLGGRSIFVQRFDDGLRAFENRCAHRFYPLRTKDKGNGPILCGFHHWRYNSDGVAVGIPNCQEMFGTIPREMNARIARLDVDTCGHLIFARFPSERRDTLRAYLAEGFAILETLCSPTKRPHRVKQTIHAHWKFSHHISLDDYHIVAVHPSSFGKQGYLKFGSFQYYRFGSHSAHYSSPDPGHLKATEQQCRDGSYQPSHYAIYNIFPNLVVTQFRVIAFGRSFWFVNVAHYHPVAPNETRVLAWFFHAPLSGDEKPWELKLRPYFDPWTLPVVAHFAAKIMVEDNQACEGQQFTAREVDAEQRLGGQEERIVWFEEAYTAALTGRPLPGDEPLAGTDFNRSIELA
jgi:phenylpropionate dioxygenase-like ring-hydroxylating dioxygenase large terminal subunit